MAEFLVRCSEFCNWPSHCCTFDMGHCRIVANEEVDKLAKIAAEDVFRARARQARFVFRYTPCERAHVVSLIRG